MKKEFAEEKKIIWKEIVPAIKADIINMKHDIKNMQKVISFHTSAFQEQMMSERKQFPALMIII